jgi:hypothetical protein
MPWEEPTNVSWLQGDDITEFDQVLQILIDHYPCSAFHIIHLCRLSNKHFDDLYSRFLDGNELYLDWLASVLAPFEPGGLWLFLTLLEEVARSLKASESYSYDHMAFPRDEALAQCAIAWAWGNFDESTRLLDELCSQEEELAADVCLCGLVKVTEEQVAANMIGREIAMRRLDVLADRSRGVISYSREAYVELSTLLYTRDGEYATLTEPIAFWEALAAQARLTQDDPLGVWTRGIENMPRAHLTEERIGFQIHALVTEWKGYIDATVPDRVQAARTLLPLLFEFAFELDWWSWDLATRADITLPTVDSRGQETTETVEAPEFVSTIFSVWKERDPQGADAFVRGQAARVLEMIHEEEADHEEEEDEEVDS